MAAWGTKGGAGQVMEGGGGGGGRYRRESWGRLAHGERIDNSDHAGSAAEVGQGEMG